MLWLNIKAKETANLLGGLVFTLTSCLFSYPAWSVTVPRFGIFEQSFTHSDSYSNPYTQLEATATLNRPGGMSRVIPLFWDGDGIVDKPNSVTLDAIRNASYDIVMAGGYFVTGFGSTYWGGYRDVRGFDVDNPKNKPWEEDVQHLHKLFMSLEWWMFEPSDNILSDPGIHYCLADAGKQYLVYVRGTSEPLSLSPGADGRTMYTIQRFDPRTGMFTKLDDYTGTGLVVLVPPNEKGHIYLLTRVLQKFRNN